MGNVISMADFKSIQAGHGPFDKRTYGRILSKLNRSAELRASVPLLSSVGAREDAVIAAAALRVEAFRLAKNAGLQISELDGRFHLDVIEPVEK